jgi:hypothetical protein
LAGTAPCTQATAINAALTNADAIISLRIGKG